MFVISDADFSFFFDRRWLHQWKSEKASWRKAEQPFVDQRVASVTFHPQQLDSALLNVLLIVPCNIAISLCTRSSSFWKTCTWSPEERPCQAGDGWRAAELNSRRRRSNASEKWIGNLLTVSPSESYGHGGAGGIHGQRQGGEMFDEGNRRGDQEAKMDRRALWSERPLKRDTGCPRPLMITSNWLI